ncbi:Phage shock protein A (PspA) family protein [Corynebacterium camporealensis]|uniref:Phage shock protein A (PspA) family protein n=1 Tax=Corynebacterium camporealensis TaxID=161896 RepID=A0A0F6TAY9_9CORY|nr:PspA/IM30 family protein [Corynebacterium camporealensis]AKE39369.1 phage shock protein A (PspA) family protein [Corynebacterium camporealensis]AVH88541.1 Phage shock protein A (PspA) family protein [Corynebacterium camporealensis]
MANPFTKAWKYFMALFDSKIEEHADPKVQIEQAIEEAQRQHQELSQQAAAVVGNQRQLEMQLNRRLSEIEKLQGNTRQALELADKARANGDNDKAVEYENAAEAFAAQLVTAEQSVEDTKKLHDQALQQAESAKKAVERNSLALREKVNERSKLLSQLEQAKMQEKVSESLSSMNELTSNGNTPSLDSVRDKIERRYSKALGQAELAENSVDARMREVEQAGVQMAGHSRLEQIRSEMNQGKAVESGQNKNQAIESGAQNNNEQPNVQPTDVSNDAVQARLRELRGE